MAIERKVLVRLRVEDREGEEAGAGGNRGTAQRIDPERRDVARKRDQGVRIARNDRQLAELASRNRIGELPRLRVYLHAAAAFDNLFLHLHRRDRQLRVDSDDRSDEDAHSLRPHRKPLGLNTDLINARRKVRDNKEAFIVGRRQSFQPCIQRFGLDDRSRNSGPIRVIHLSGELARVDLPEGHPGQKGHYEQSRPKRFALPLEKLHKARHLKILHSLFWLYSAFRRAYAVRYGERGATWGSINSGTGSAERPGARSTGILIGPRVAPRSPYRTAGICFRPNIFLNSIPEFISDMHVKLVGLFIGSEIYAGVNAADKARLRPHTFAGLT